MKITTPINTNSCNFFLNYLPIPSLSLAIILSLLSEWFEITNPCCHWGENYFKNYIDMKDWTVRWPMLVKPFKPAIFRGSVYCARINAR